MKINRKAAAYIIWEYRKAVRENINEPTEENWRDVSRYFHMVSALGMINIISTMCSLRSLSMFDECTAIV